MHIVTTGSTIDRSRIFQIQLPENCWTNIGNFIESLARMPVWVNHDLSVTVFSGKRNYDFWQSIFSAGNTPDGTHVLPRGINLMDMIQGRS